MCDFKQIPIGIALFLVLSTVTAVPKGIGECMKVFHPGAEKCCKDLSNFLPEVIKACLNERRDFGHGPPLRPPVEWDGDEFGSGDRPPCHHQRPPTGHVRGPHPPPPPVWDGNDFESEGRFLRRAQGYLRRPPPGFPRGLPPPPPPIWNGEDFEPENGFLQRPPLGLRGPPPPRPPVWGGDGFESENGFLRRPQGYPRRSPPGHLRGPPPPPPEWRSDDVQSGHGQMRRPHSGHPRGHPHGHPRGSPPEWRSDDVQSEHGQMRRPPSGHPRGHPHGHPRGSPPCDIETCVAKKIGYLSNNNGTRNSEALIDYLSSLNLKEDIFNDIEIHCLNGDLSKYGPEDFCELIKLKNCMQLQFLKNCSEWENATRCASMKNSVNDCAKIVN